tara:strand:- start:519 stop:1049 length:531 start_codon:yes stop_codon:yes gene_type:complete
MNSFEINKLITAILVTVLIVFGIGKVSDIIFKVKTPELQGYKVEINTAVDDSLSSTESQIDISALLAMGSSEHGKKVFKKCAACHSIKQGGGNKIGPALYSVVGRDVGGVSEYKYSKSLMTYKKKWTFEELNGFLLKPATWIKGNKMGFAGLKKEEDRASVILYLNEMGDNPTPLP